MQRLAATHPASRIPRVAGLACLLVTSAFLSAGEARPLFERDLRNAEMTPGAWAFDADGVLAPTRPDGAKDAGDLWTKESYGDFVLSLEFRTAKKSNSGVFIRSSDIVKWMHNSIEIQILQGHEDAPAHLAGAIYDISPPSPVVEIVPHQWHRLQITAAGSEIAVAIDGVTVNRVDLERWTQVGRNPDGTTNKFKKAYRDMERRGRVGLQDYGMPIAFRHLTIEPRD